MPKRNEDPYSEANVTAFKIMQLFRTMYKDQWVPQSKVTGKTRTWTIVLNKLVKQGFIERKKSQGGYQYRWVAKKPF